MDGKAFLNSFLATLAALIVFGIVVYQMKVLRRRRGNVYMDPRMMLANGGQQMQYMPGPGQQQYPANTPASFNPQNGIPQQIMPFNFISTAN